LQVLQTAQKSLVTNGEPLTLSGADEKGVAVSS
jgi:hypothetical protein